MAKIPREPGVPVLRIKELADKLGKSTATLEDWRERKSGPDWWYNGRNIEYPIDRIGAGVADIARNGLNPLPPKPDKDPRKVAQMRDIQRQGIEAAAAKRRRKKGQRRRRDGTTARRPRFGGTGTGR